jgi:hypothetical protein
MIANEGDADRSTTHQNGFRYKRIEKRNERETNVLGRKLYLRRTRSHPELSIASHGLCGDSRSDLGL